jgi:flagellar biosynthetic protein FliR
MITITSQQWYAWIAAFFWPFLRVLGLILAEPVLGNRAVPVQVKIGFAIFVTLVLAPLLPPMPDADPASAAGVLIAIQQLLIGLAMGFTIRIALTAAEMAGQLAGLQMGLGFAVFFDPQSSAQTAVVGQFVGLFAILIFLSTNGHALVLTALVDSFAALPVAATPLQPLGLRVLVQWGAVIFTAGLTIALPVIAALLIANIAVGIMTRAAPQLNLFAVGFPITLMTGFVALYLAVPYMAPALAQLFEQAVLAMGRIVEAFGSR